MTTTASGYGAVNDYFNWSDIVAGNRRDLFGLSGVYDPFYTGQAPQTGTFLPTLGAQQLASNTAQWGAQNALGNRSLDAQIGQWGAQNALDTRKLDAQIGQWAAQNRLDEGTLTGFYNGLPTLARDALAAQVGIANADNFRQWAQLRGSQLLQQQAQDDAMRVAGGQARLGTLGLLASQRGPENFMAYNWLENSLNSPDLAATDPFTIAARIEAGVPARSNVDLGAAWGAGPPGGGVPLPNMSAPAGSTASAGGGGSGAGGGGGGYTSPPAAASGGYTAPAGGSGFAITGNAAQDAALLQAPASDAGPGWVGADPATLAEFNRISRNMGGYAEGTPPPAPMLGGAPDAMGVGIGGKDSSGMPAATAADDIDWTKYLTEFAPRSDKVFMADDPTQQDPTQPNPEVTLNLDGGRFIVIPLRKMEPADAQKVMAKMSTTGPGGAPPMLPGFADGTPMGRSQWTDWMSRLGNSGLGQWWGNSGAANGGFTNPGGAGIGTGEQPSSGGRDWPQAGQGNPWDYARNFLSSRGVSFPGGGNTGGGVFPGGEGAQAPGGEGASGGTYQDNLDWAAAHFQNGRFIPGEPNSGSQWWSSPGHVMPGSAPGHGGTGGGSDTGGGVPAVPNQQITGPAGGGGAANGMNVTLPWGATSVDPSAGYWGGKQGYRQEQGTLPAFAGGTDGYDTNTAFGNFGTFTPEQLAQTPVVRQLAGQAPVNQWQHYGGGPETMTLPGTNTRLPGTFNVTDFLRMSPSARGMAQSLYETPRAMGGLGLSWSDIAQASQRAAPVGAYTGMPRYGYQ